MITRAFYRREVALSEVTPFNMQQVRLKHMFQPHFLANLQIYSSLPILLPANRA
jgi:hypothetical protein